MKITPIGERVVIKQIKGEEKTASGIYIPKEEDKKQGIVEEVGQFKDGSSLPLRKGDRVVFTGYGNEEIEINKQKYVIIEFKDIVARLEE
jgi:chaperonin GroES